MKSFDILVVDDELPIRRWFVAALKKVKTVRVDTVYEAANGADALSIFREKHPKVIFTDIKMPVLDGLGLLRQVKQEAPKTFVVIITSYSEFSYAKEAISQNAYDYVLKTEVNLPKLEALMQRIASEADTDPLSLQLDQRVFLHGLLDDASRLEQVTEEDFLAHKILLKEQAMFAAAFYTNEMNLALVDEIVVECGVENITFYAHDRDRMVVMANLKGGNQAAMQDQAIYQFAHKLGKCFNSAVGVSQIGYKYSRLAVLISSSISALGKSYYDPGRTAIFRCTVDHENVNAETALQQAELRLAAEIGAGNQQNARQKLCEILDLIDKRRPDNIGMVKDTVFRSVVNYSMLIFRYQPDSTAKIIELNRIIQNESSFASMRAGVDRFLHQLENSTAEVEKYSLHVTKAIKYIQNHYAEIQSVIEISDYLGLNPDYFSRLFVNETKMSLNRYLNTTRLNQAVWLLTNTNVRTGIIAEQVGYSDSGYFSRLFKKQFNMTPQEFRAAHNKGAAKKASAAER